MRARLERILERYGQAVTLRRRDGGEPAETRAFLRPILKSRETPPAATPLGAVCGQRWLYIGEANAPLAPGDQVWQDGERFTAEEVQAVRWRDEILYRRAILRRGKEAAE